MYDFLERRNNIKYSFIKRQKIVLVIELDRSKKNLSFLVAIKRNVNNELFLTQA